TRRPGTRCRGDEDLALERHGDRRGTGVEDQAGALTGGRRDDIGQHARGALHLLDPPDPEVTLAAHTQEGAVELEGGAGDTVLLVDRELAVHVGLRQPGALAGSESEAGGVLLPRHRDAAPVAALLG